MEVVNMFKVGQKVEVINEGEQYTTYNEWIEKNAPKFLGEFTSRKLNAVNKLQGVVVAKASHGEFHGGQDGTYMLYLVKHPNGIFLIGEDGLKAVISEPEKTTPKELQTWEMMKELAENSSKKFRSERKYTRTLVTAEVLNQVVIFKGVSLDADDESAYLSMHRKWVEEIPKVSPVELNFQDILNYDDSDKSRLTEFVCVHPLIETENISYTLDDFLEMLAKDFFVVNIKDILCNGKFYIQE